mgnify:CR=1 FL=1|tara:strand:- start:254 stop:511 length:258 start_codon:yes stop_codon:yes gene_type:complete
MKTQGYTKKKYSKSYKGKKYNKRRRDDVASTTLAKIMFGFKYAIYLTPICCCIIATWVDPSLYTKWMMTAVHTLSLSILIQLTEK